MENALANEACGIGGAVEVSLAAQICAISDRYERRGLARAVATSAGEQVEAESKTRALAPDAYRMSALSDAAIRGMYRRGKDVMSSNDLLRYFGETRAKRIQQRDFSDETGVYEGAIPNGDSLNASDMAMVAVEKKEKSLSIASITDVVKKKLDISPVDWFCAPKAEPKHEKRTRRFPLSAFAAMIAVAVSLMLIVASSVLVTRAESRISALTVEATSLGDEVEELRSDSEVGLDLLQLRQIATEEFGMVDEDYLEMHFLNTENEETVTAYEQERDGSIGLSALLSAMGIKK